MDKRGVRLLAGVLVPAAVGACILFMLSYIDDRPDGIELHVDSFWLKELMKFLIYLLLGYIFVGIQSIIYSILMEYYINPKINNDAVVICISSTLGCISGAVILIPALAAVGLVTGFVTGIYLRRSYKNAANNRLQIDAATPRV